MHVLSQPEVHHHGSESYSFRDLRAVWANDSAHGNCPGSRGRKKKAFPGVNKMKNKLDQVGETFYQCYPCQTFESKIIGFYQKRHEKCRKSPFWSYRSIVLPIGTRKKFGRTLNLKTFLKAWPWFIEKEKGVQHFIREMEMLRVPTLIEISLVDAEGKRRALKKFKTRGYLK